MSEEHELLKEAVTNMLSEMTTKHLERMCQPELHDTCTSTKEVLDGSLTVDMLLETFKKLKPEYAILINAYAEANKVFEIDIEEIERAMKTKSKYFCRKLLVMDAVTYRKLVEKHAEITKMQVYGFLK
jgi:hypothetical protein